MPTTIKKCNFCHAELSVSNESQFVECPACGCINGYGSIRSSQNDKGGPSNKNTGVMPNSHDYQQPTSSVAPTQGQAQLHAILGGTKQQRSLHFVDTKSLFPPEYSPPPVAKAIGFLQPPPQVSQVSTRMLKTNYTSFQQPSQKSPSLQTSLPPVKTKITCQLPSPTSSPLMPERIINNLLQQPQQTSSPQGSPRPAYTNSTYHQPLPTMIPEKTNNLSQRISSPQWPSRPAYSNASQSFKTSQPLIQDKPENFSQLAPETSSSQGSPRLENSNTSYRPLLQSSPPAIQENSNSISETASLKGSPNPSYSNSSNQQPIKSSPKESPHQPQTLSPQGSSPRPSRFSNFLRPQAFSPLPHNEDQRPSQPFSQISTPPSGKDNNDHNQISAPPSREANNGYRSKPLLAASPQISSSQVQPRMQAPRLSVNSSRQKYQKSVPETRPISSSIDLTPPLTVTGAQHIRYGTNPLDGAKELEIPTLSFDEP